MRASRVVVIAGLSTIIGAACDLATGPKTGAIRVTVATSGVDLDADGYGVRIDTGVPQPVALNGTLLIAGVPTGTRVVRLQGISPNCGRADNFATHSVNVTAGDTVETSFGVTCSEDVGVLRVSVTTTGADLDADGYTLSVDGAPAQPLDANTIVFIAGVRTGTRAIEIGGLAENCHLASTNPVSLTIEFGAIASTGYLVNCIGLTGKLRVTTTTTGVGMDPDGYEIVVNDVAEHYHIAVNSEVTIDLGHGDRTVSLLGVAANCTVSGSNPRMVSVAAKATTDAIFSLTCPAPASAQIKAVTTGVDPDPNGYVVSVAGNSFSFSTNLGVNGTTPVTGMGAGNHTVTLSGMAMNCDVSGSNPRTVAMVSGVSTDVTFDVACTAITQLAYSHYTAGSAEIFVVNSNGTGFTRLTTSVGDDAEPSWSPDGSKIVFRSARDGNQEIYVMSATGTNPVRLTNNLNQDYDPTWSPDGSKIAFVSDRDGQHDIYVMNADGSNVVRLTNHLSSDLEPAWSPDGTKIAFRREGNGSSNIYVMNADGTGVTQITAGGSDRQPDWSPDGSKIAFAREVSCDSYYYTCFNNVFVMNADGSNVKQLVSDADDSQPSWSPDGRWIAVASYKCGYYDCSYSALVAIKSDGKARAEILPIDVGNPSWRR